MRTILAIALFASSGLLAQPEPVKTAPREIRVDAATCKPVTGEITFGFKNATLGEVLEQIGRLKCMSFLVSAEDERKLVTIEARGPIDVRLANAALLEALDAHELALVPAWGNSWKVVPSTQRPSAGECRGYECIRDRPNSFRVERRGDHVTVHVITDRKDRKD